VIQDYILLAFENLKHRGLRSWLTLLGVFIGIAAVVSLISLGQGLQDAVTGQFETLDADKLTIQNAGTGFGPPGSTVVEKLTEDDLELVESVPGVDITIARLVRVVSVEYNDVQKFSYVASVTEDNEEIEIVKDALNAEIEQGRFLQKGDSGEVVVGQDFTGDDFGKPVELGTRLILQGETFEVVGIVEQTSSFITNGAILMMEGDMKDLLEIEDEIDLIVGGIGIANTMYTAILERTKEIGTMKAVGARNSDILLIFVIESGFIGLVGGIIGVLVGFGISKGIEWIAVKQLSTTLLQVSTPFSLFIGCLIFAFLAGVISGAIPAYQASRTSPVEALRYE